MTTLLLEVCYGTGLYIHTLPSKRFFFAVLHQLRSVAIMLPVILSLVIFSVAGASTATLPTQCGCGYQDPDTKQLYTEALIVYFNETDAIDTDIFLVQDFAHKKEHGWNSVWKQGAKTSNANITNDTTIWPHVQALELHTDPSKPNHVVNGGNLRSVRRDIQYGSFRAAMRGAAQWVGGTALSMQLKYNNSESLEFDVMNMNDPTEARVAYLVNGTLKRIESISVT